MLDDVREVFDRAEEEEDEEDYDDQQLFIDENTSSAKDSAHFMLVEAAASPMKIAKGRAVFINQTQKQQKDDNGASHTFSNEFKISAQQQA